jgi:hypothetical protein
MSRFGAELIYPVLAQLYSVRADGGQEHGGDGMSRCAVSRDWMTPDMASDILMTMPRMQRAM